jgi:hypothetical protein
MANKCRTYPETMIVIFANFRKREMIFFFAIEFFIVIYTNAYEIGFGRTI